MRAAFFILALIVVGSNAFLFDGLGDSFTKIKEAGSNIVKGIISKGKEVLTSLLGKAADALKGVGSTSTASAAAATTKRDLSDFFKKMAALKKSILDKMDNHGQKSSGSFKAALDNLKQKWAQFKKDKNVDNLKKDVDAVVDAHDKDQKRFLVDTFKSVASTVGKIASNPIVQAAGKAALTAAIGKRFLHSSIPVVMNKREERFLVDTLKSVASTVGKIASNPIVQTVGKAALVAALTKREDERFLVDTFKSVASTVGKIASNPIVQAAGKAALTAAIGKRFFQDSILLNKREDERFLVDTLKSVASTVGKVVSNPIVQTVGKAALVAALTKREDERFLVDTLKSVASTVGKIASNPIVQAVGKAALTAAVTKREDERFLVDTFKSVASTVGKIASNPIVQAVGKAALTAAVTKRSVLSSVGDFFAPHVKTLSDAVKGVGDTLKGHATNLWNAVKGQVATLGQKLSGHVDKLKEHGSTILQHGKNAWDALKGAVGDILSQTLQNAKPAIDGLVKTGSDAVGTVANHVADAVSGASSGN